MLGEPFGGERHPVHFLRAEIRAHDPRLLENSANARNGVALEIAEIGLGDEREHSRGVAQSRTIVGPRDAFVALGVERLERSAKGIRRARAWSPSIASAAASCALASEVVKASSLASVR